MSRIGMKMSLVHEMSVEPFFIHLHCVFVWNILINARRLDKIINRNYFHFIGLFFDIVNQLLIK